MQSTYSSSRITEIHYNDKFFSMINDIFIIIDVLISTYFFFFNLNRTLNTGIWMVLAFQLIFLPIFIMSTLIESKMRYNWTIKSLGNPKKTSYKQPLAHTMGVKKEDANVYENPNVGIMNGLRMGIYLLLAMNIIISLNFVFLGIMVDSLRGVENGELIIYYMILDQAYYLPPILLMILIYLKLRGKSNVDQEITKWKPDLMKQKKSSLNIPKLSRQLQRLLIASLLLYLLSASVFAVANQSEDNQNMIIDIDGQTNFDGIQIYGMFPSDQNVEIFAYAGSRNQYNQFSPHLVKFTYDTSSEKIVESIILQDLVRSREVIIENAIFDDSAYIFTFNNLDLTYTLYEYKLGTDKVEIIYFWDDSIEGGFDFRKNYQSFNYLLSPFEGGIHIIQTQLPYYLGESLIAETTVRTITDEGPKDTILDLIVLDAITFQDQTYFLSFSSDTNNFEITSFNETGPNFANGKKSNSILTTQNSENTLNFRTPNSATLFIAKDNLFYRSTENLFDITNSKNSPFQTELLTDEFKFRYRGMKGSVLYNDILYFNSEIVVEYISLTTLEKIQTAKAINSKYFGSTLSNMIAQDDQIFSATNDGRIYVWDSDPKAVSDDRTRVRNLIVAAIAIYFSSASLFFLLRRKLD